jgi:hypothetical protein
MRLNEIIKQLYEDRRMPQRKLEYSKIKRGEQVLALAGNLSQFAGEQIFLLNAEGLCAGWGILQASVKDLLVEEKGKKQQC